MKKDPESVARGKKLKALREKIGLSQDKLGALLEITGAAWRQYELGVRTPDDKVKKRIAFFFNKTVDELFFETQKWIAQINEYTAKSLEWNGDFDLYIYKDNEEVYRHRVRLFSLKDASVIIRHQLELKGKRITWEKDE